MNKDKTMDETDTREFTRDQLNKLRLLTRKAIQTSEGLIEYLETVKTESVLDEWALEEERRNLAELRELRMALR